MSKWGEVVLAAWGDAKVGMRGESRMGGEFTNCGMLLIKLLHERLQ